jgi:hypothetical protein
VTYWQTTLALLAAVSASLALADDFKTIDGKEYKNDTVSRVEPDGIVLKSNSGVSKVYFTELPKGVQERFHYDAQQAAQYTAQTIEENKISRQQETEEAQKRAEQAAQLAMRRQQQQAEIERQQQQAKIQQRQEAEAERRQQEAGQPPQTKTAAQVNPAFPISGGDTGAYIRTSTGSYN